MGYEIDFLAVGDGSRSGDAIALRYGNLFGPRSEQTVIIIDGGFADDGEALVEHVRTHYGTDEVDIVVSTHPDCDHINGLTVVVDELYVGELWIHQPAVDRINYLVAAATARSEGRKERLQRLTRSLSDVDDLVSLATRRGVLVREPFTGVASADGRFWVAGPSKSYYDGLVEDFRSYERTGGFLAKVWEFARRASETLFHETLDEESETSPENNSSAITILEVDGRASIFTGDAGADGLHRAADTLDSAGFDWSTVRFMQVPHHGSQRNVTPSVLERYVGKAVQYEMTKTAFVSCAPDGKPKHPNSKVVNAFIRRGANVFETAGQGKWHSHDAPARSGWGPATPLSFSDEVEE